MAGNRRYWRQWPGSSRSNAARSGSTAPSKKELELPDVEFPAVRSSGNLEIDGKKKAISYDLKSGEVLWQCGGQAGNPIASPVVRDGVVFLMTGFRSYAIQAIPLSARGDITRDSSARGGTTRGGHSSD